MDTTVLEINKNTVDNNGENQKNTQSEDMQILKEVDKTFDAMREDNCFKRTKNMANVMEGQKGGGFYAAILHDKGTKNNQIGVVIKYPDGDESEVLRFSQGEFIQAGRNQFQQVTNIKGIKKTKALPFAKKFEDTLMDYMTPDMPIWPNVVMRTIYEKYNNLPVIKRLEKVPNIEEIYKYLLMVVEELSLDENKGYINHKDYYRFKTDDFEKIAKGMGMKVDSLVNTLNSYGLINRTPSAIGCQTKTNFKGQRIYTYNICKQPSVVKVEVQKNVEGEFPTAKFDVKYLSPSEQHRLKKEEAEKELIEKMKIKDWALKELLIEFGLADKKDIIPENCGIGVIITDESSKGSKSNDIECKSDESSKSSKSDDIVEK